MTEYERGFIDGIKSKVSAELTPTLINVSRTMLEMLKPVLSTALENVLNDNNAIPAADVQPVKHGYWEEVTDYGGWGDTNYRCSVCGEEWYLEDGKPKDNNMNFCPRCGAKMNLNSVANDKTRNLTDEETDIYNDQLEAEAETIEKVSLLSEKVEYKDPCKCCHNGKCEQCYYGYCSEEDKKKKWLENHKRK